VDPARIPRTRMQQLALCGFKGLTFGRGGMSNLGPEVAAVPRLVNGPCLLNVVWGGKTPDLGGISILSRADEVIE
jgi:hypothetical protein